MANRIASGHATKGDEGALDEGADMMMLVQVPLKHRAPHRGFFGMGDSLAAPSSAMEGASDKSVARREVEDERSDVEQAVIGHGDAMGPHEECGGLELERDDRFPVRVTVQFYKATSNGVVS